MIKEPFRLGQLFVLMMSLFVLTASFYFQLVIGLEPCPLCVMQRICVACVVILCFMGIFFKNSATQKRIILFQLFIGIAGLYFASRQLWLQTLSPEQLGSCLPGLSVLIHYFPWFDVVKALFLGAADCGEVTWEWLGLSMAAWSALYFFVFMISLCIISRLSFFADK